MGIETLRHYSQLEVANMFGLAASTISRAITRGDIPAPELRKGSRKYYTERQLEAIRAYYGPHLEINITIMEGK